MNLGFKLRELLGCNANLLCIQYPLVSSSTSLEILGAKVNEYKHEIHIAFCAMSDKSFICNQESQDVFQSSIHKVTLVTYKQVSNSDTL